MMFVIFRRVSDKQTKPKKKKKKRKQPHKQQPRQQQKPEVVKKFLFHAERVRHFTWKITTQLTYG